MYYAKYLKYKNKYLNLKYQLGGTFEEIIIKSPKIQDITIPSEPNDTLPKGIIISLKNNLVGLKLLESNSKVLTPLVKYNSRFKTNPIYFYRYSDKVAKVASYIICSLYSYYEFLDILYEHLEIEEININKAGDITSLVPNRIYHIIPKPDRVPRQTITLPIKNSVISNLDILVDSLKKNSFIIIRKDGWDLRFLTVICMYNLFIGTIYIFDIVIDEKKTNFFLLSLFTKYELEQYIGRLPDNIKIYECRLYKQGDSIEFILYKNFVAMMFNKYQDLKITGKFGEKLIRGNQDIDNKLLDELDKDLIDKCSRCISVEDIAFNTTIFLLPEKISDIIKDNEILEIKKNFIEKLYYLINSNKKFYDNNYGNKELDRLREFNFEEIKKEIEELKKKLLGLEPCHKELLVQKLIELGFEGSNMEEILEKSALCYLDKKDKNKKLLYEYPIQKDKDKKFVRECKFIPEMKRLLETNLNPESELHKYRQTILFLIKDTENEKKYMRNQLYFFVDSFHLTRVPTFNKIFELFGWNYNLNKLCFQCLAMRDWLIFPIRIINIEYLQSPFSFEFDIKKQEFCGFIHTRFTDDFNGNKDFNKVCNDKLLFLYSNTYDTNRYRLFHFTGNSTHTNVSILSNYKISSNEINWIYYTFIIKYEKIPHFYQYITDNNEKEVLVSIFSLEEIRRIYIENDYDVCELELLIEVFYNFLYNKRENLNPIFIEKSLFISKEQENKFIDDVIKKNTKL